MSGYIIFGSDCAACVASMTARIADLPGMKAVAADVHVDALRRIVPKTISADPISPCMLVFAHHWKAKPGEGPRDYVTKFNNAIEQAWIAAGRPKLNWTIDEAEGLAMLTADWPRVSQKDCLAFAQVMEEQHEFIAWVAAGG